MKKFVFPISRRFPELSAAARVLPEDIIPGRFYSILGSDRLVIDQTTFAWTGAEPTTNYLMDQAPAVRVPFLVLAYCFPLISAVFTAGDLSGTRTVIDVREHTIVELSRRFVASLLPPNSETRRAVFSAPYDAASRDRTRIDEFVKRASAQADKKDR